MEKTINVYPRREKKSGLGQKWKVSTVDIRIKKSGLKFIHSKVPSSVHFNLRFLCESDLRISCLQEAMDKGRVVYRHCHLSMDYIVGKLENCGIRAMKKLSCWFLDSLKKNIWTFKKSTKNVLLLYIRSPPETEVLLNNLVYSEHKIIYWSYLKLR